MSNNIDRRTGARVDRDGGVSVTDARWDIPRDPVESKDGGTAKIANALHVDGVAGELVAVRAAIVSEGAETAALRLANMTAGAIQISPDSELPLALPTDGSDGEITDLYLLVLGTGAATAGIVDSSTVTLVSDQHTTEAGKVAALTATAAQIPTALIHIEYDEAWEVRDVVITFHKPFDSDTQAYVTLEARSYA